MASATVRGFLETSTIHGLVHISTAKSRVARATWVAIVVACFAIATHMITSSYKEWQESPVSTTITTHPITKLEFPTVTVCPPRGSKTALNHLLEKVQDVNFTEEERKELLEISKEVFIEIPNKNHAKYMGELLSIDNMRSIANGRGSVLESTDQQMITITSSELEGIFETAGFDDSKYMGDFCKRPYFLHYRLDLPEDIDKVVEKGALLISVQTQGSWSYRIQGQQLYENKLAKLRRHASRVHFAKILFQ